MLLKTNPNPNVDILARRLAYLGAFARLMPPAWDGAEISHPVCGPDGQYVGRMLPGKGLYLDIDPHYAGITQRRNLPYVYPRTPVQRLLEVLGDSRRAIRALDVFKTIMALPLSAITTYDGIIAGRAGGKAYDVTISKTSFTTVANVWSTLYRAGGFPVAGTYTNIPGGAAHDRSSTGAWSVGLTNPTAPDKQYLLTFGYTAGSQINMAILADLLVAAGNISASITTSQTINTTALTRYTNGKGVLMTYEITTALGTGTGAMATGGVTYTDQDGNSSNVVGAGVWTSPASGIVQRIVPTDLGPYMTLASGDYGVRSVESFQLSTAHSAGVLALNIYFPLAFVPGLASNAYVERDSTIQVDGLIELAQTSGNVLGCLMAYVLPNTTSTGVYTAFIRTVQG